MCVRVFVVEMMTRLQVVCVTSLTSDAGLEVNAAEDLLAVRQAAAADVDTVCTRSVTRFLSVNTASVTSVVINRLYLLRATSIGLFFSAMPVSVSVRDGWHPSYRRAHM